MKKIFLTLAFTGITTSMFAYSNPGDEIGVFIINWSIVIMAILNFVLFFKLLDMTKDVKGLKNKFCKNEIENLFQLRTTMVKLKHTGEMEKAKKILDSSLKNEVFSALAFQDKNQQDDIEKIKRRFEKYYKYLNCEMPFEIQKLDVERIKEDYSSLRMDANQLKN